MRWIRRIGYGLLSAAAIAGALYVSTGTGETDGAARLRSFDRGGRSRLNGGWDALLRLLNPPGAGYDSTNISLTTGSGGAVTFTRADTWTCQDSSGAIRSLASGKPCVVDGLSLKVRSAVTNNLLRSAELDNASWDFGEGSATGETLTDDSAANAEGIFQSVSTTTTGAWTLACYVQSGTLTSLRLGINVTGGTGSASCVFSDLSTTTQRKTCTITAGAGVTALNAIVSPSNTAADTGSIKVGGCQLVTGSVPGDYCPTAGAVDTCAAESASVATPASLSINEGCACANITPTWTGGNPQAVTISFLYGNTVPTARFMYAITTGTELRASDGTTTAAVEAGFTSGVRKRYCTRWSTSQNKLRVENVAAGTSGETTFDGFGAYDANLYVGNSGTGALQPNASLDSVVFGRSFNACN